MQKVRVVSNISKAFEDVTEEIQQIIYDEVNQLAKDVKKKAWDVRDTRHFWKEVGVARRTNFGWRIRLKAKYSSILWSGRRKVGNRYYGSENWAGGGEPMMQLMENKIVRRTDNVSK